MRTDVSSASGYSQKWINAGEIQNKGIEIQLNIVPVKTSDFSWDMSFNWAKNINKVIKLEEGINTLLLGTGVGSVTFNATEGESYGVIKGTDYVYAPDGQRVINPTTGAYKVTSTKTNVIGNIMPDWVGSIRNTFSYKGVSLSFLIDGQKGGSIYSADMYYGTMVGLYPETVAIRADGYILPGVIQSTTDPNIYTANNVTVKQNPADTGDIVQSAGYASKEFVYDASFIKLREASIIFNLPKNWFEGTFIKDAKFSLFGRNLWVIHKNIPYADPEAGTSSATSAVQGNNLSRGYSIGAMPTVRTFGANFTFKF